MPTKYDWIGALYLDFIYPDRVQPTDLQRQIERRVTNGLDYNSGTVFVDEYPHPRQIR